MKLARRRGVGYAVGEVSRDALIRVIDHPELPLRIHTRDTIKAGRSALLVRGEFPIGGRMVSVAYKRVRRKNAWKMLSAWLFGNRTLRTWNMSLKLDRLGIPTARGLLVVLPRWYQPTRPSYVAWEWLDQAKNLTAYSAWLAELPAYQQRHWLHDASEKLGEVLGKMHNARISHRDLKAGNLLLFNRSSSVEAFVIDLDGAHQSFWLTSHRRVRDLSRLALAVDREAVVTPSARLRFLLAYLRMRGEQPKAVWKELWRKLARLVIQRRQKKSSRGTAER